MSYSSSSSSKKKSKTSSSNVIRVCIKCSWSGARLIPQPSTTTTTTTISKITKTTTLAQVIECIPSNQLPSIITSPVSTNADVSMKDDNDNTNNDEMKSTLNEPSIVYMRTKVSKLNWSRTTLGSLIEGQSHNNTTLRGRGIRGRPGGIGGTGGGGGESIMLTLNLPSSLTSPTDATAPSSSASMVMDATKSNNDETTQNVNENVNSTEMNPLQNSSGPTVVVPVAATSINETEPMDIDTDSTINPLKVVEPTKESPSLASTPSMPAPYTSTTINQSQPEQPEQPPKSNLTSKTAIQNILQSNFDSTSIAYFQTLLKIIDNILSTPTPIQSSFRSVLESNVTTTNKSIKVRMLRLGNAMIQKKIVNTKFGLDLLLQVIGFTLYSHDRINQERQNHNERNAGFDFDRSRANNTLLNSNNVNTTDNPKNDNDMIVLQPDQESKEKILSVRNDIVVVLQKDLNVPVKDIPIAPSAIATQQEQTSSFSSSSKAKPTMKPFDPYKPHSFNTQSAAKGLSNPNSVIPNDTTSHEKSSTERQLEILQNKQKKLEESMQSTMLDRNIIAYLPNVDVSPIVSLSTGNATNTDIVQSSSGGTKGDASLIAQQMRKREEERKKREEGGFTTKAMRDLERIKKQKVYSHVQLRINFPDGCLIEGKFLPNERVKVVKDVIGSYLIGGGAIKLEFDLYVSPPRRLLDVSKTLSEEGLVPAAKIHVSWKDGKAPISSSLNGRPGSYIQPELFQTPASPFQNTNASNVPSVGGSSFPESKPLMDNKEPGSSTNDTKPSATSSNEKKTSNSREEELLMKMMGKKVGGFSGKGNKLGSTSNSEKKGGKPKWFKK